MVSLAAAWEGVDSRRSEGADEYELERPSVMPSKEPVMTIKTEEGDVIDCVHIYAQPAFDNPLLKDHVIKTKPKGLEVTKELLPQSHGAGIKNQRRCPQGTVPILRQLTNGHNALNIPPSYSTNANAISNSEDYREFAAVRGQYASEVLGAVGNLNIWKPEVEPNEYSASRIIVLSGTSDGQLYQDHILAGWIVFPSKFSDSQPRFYTHWQANGTAGCFNLDCPGFVQVSPKQVFGGSLPASAYKKIQIHIFVGIFKDEHGNWWLQFNQDPIGYWPGSLFPYLSSGANSTEWGGEILNTRPGGNRSTTQMGSGHPWFEGFRSAAYISSMRYVDRDDEKQQLQVVNVDSITPFVTNEGCNQAAYYGNDDWMHRHLFFGGTHNNSTCS
ncbi:uncharacterized protein LOC116245747 [Nymphaea colorata]|nr:uncharacterized protein LOC116245747 [Nymphaea colorata]